MRVTAAMLEADGWKQFGTAVKGRNKFWVHSGALDGCIRYTFHEAAAIYRKQKNGEQG